ncbi:MAG: DUF2917 domain-containing protein [Caldimonas sp.]
MNTQTMAAADGRVAAGALQTLRSGHVVPLGSAGGRLEVLRGRVWLTREGDLADHLVETGESFGVTANGRAVVETWDDDAPALISWRGGTLIDRASAFARSTLSRGWRIVDPAPRISVGTVAALLALFVTAAMFGPLSDARSRALAGPALLHNTPVSSAPIGAASRDQERNSIDAGAATSRRAHFAAQKARRRAAIPA